MTDVAIAIHSVIKEANEAIEHYNKIIRLCDGIDYVTQDLCIKLLADEEKHRRKFVGILKEYKKRELWRIGLVMNFLEGHFLVLDFSSLIHNLLGGGVIGTGSLGSSGEIRGVDTAAVRQ